MPDVLNQIRSALRGRYAIEREIGHGGMATVYLARDLKHPRAVAIKVIRPELTVALGPDRFLREIAITAELHHPNILTLIDSGEADGLLYYVMPYVEGESFRSRLKQEPPLSTSEIVRLLQDVVDALAHAHRHGVVHRDIKPDNVMLSEGHAYVLDFGVAKAVSDASTGEDLTTAGDTLGSPTYMAPEQAAGDPRIDHRADIYAVGVLAYELLTGKPPFSGTPQAVLAAHISTSPEPIKSLRSDLPPPLARMVMKCLEKAPAARFQSTDELLREIEALTTHSGGMAAEASGTTRSPFSRRLVAIVAALALLLIGGFAFVRVAQNRREGWVHQKAIPLIQRLVLDRSVDSAYAVAIQAAAILPNDSTLGSLWPRFSAKVVFHTSPEGAKVYRANYADTSSWQLLGTTPTDSVRLPSGGQGRQLSSVSRIRIEKPGFRSLQLVVWPVQFPIWPQIAADTFQLDRIGAPDSEMVRVKGGAFMAAMPGLQHTKPLRLGDFLMDRYEVTNTEFKAFVVAGGYTRKEYWEYDFVRAGRRLSFEEAMMLFRDKVGRPGPSTWEGGTAPVGQGNLPVGGVSWYEAAAYAKFLGKSLPSVWHWNRAAAPLASAWIVPGSNFGTGGPTPGSRFRGLGPFGTFDMAGNVREWCQNAVGNKRYILGGDWSTKSYMFAYPDAADPFDRSPINGIRLAKYPREEPSLALAVRPLEQIFRDYSLEKPVPDVVFATLRRMYDYDRAPLNARVETRDTTEDDWIKEKVSFDAAYGNERVAAYLFLPKRRSPPFQTVVHFPGSYAIKARVSTTLNPVDVAFLVRSGRAVIWPVYKSTFERGDGLDTDYPDETLFWRDHVVMWINDVRRSIDYLATRSDVDTTRLGYYGLSWGAVTGGIVSAIEPRLKAEVLDGAGLQLDRARPEVDVINFLPRVTIPVLMINGKYDHLVPTATSQEPMFRFLGSAIKRNAVYEGGHLAPRSEAMKQALIWFDKYLGPVR